MSVLAEVRRAAAQRLLYLPHAVAQMARPERMISPSEVRAVVRRGLLSRTTPTTAVDIAVFSRVVGLKEERYTSCVHPERIISR